MRALGETSLGDGSVDVDGDGIGDYCPTGEYCGPDQETDTKKDLEDTSKIIDIISKVLDFIKDLAKREADNKLKKEFNDSRKKMDDGMDKMKKSLDEISPNRDRLNETNQQIQRDASKLSDLSRSLSEQSNTLSALTSALNQLNGNLASQSQSLSDSMSRLDSAMDRSNYPLGIAGLQQQRADARSANFDNMQNRLAIANTNQSISDVSGQRNSVGADYNNTLGLANNTSSNIATSYAQAQSFQNAINAGVQNYNNGASTVSQSVNDARGAVSSYQNTINTSIVPMAGTASGLSGVAQVTASIAQGNYATATAQGLNSSLRTVETAIGPVVPATYTALLSTATNLAGQAIDRGGTGAEVIQKFSQDMGQTLARTSDALRVIQNVGVAFDIASNSSNRNAGYESANLLAQQVGTAVGVVGQVASTASMFIPGLQGQGPAINYASGVLGTAGQGVASTVVETAQKIYTGGISISPGNYPPSSVGRNLVLRDNGGPASAGTVALTGAFITLTKTAQQAIPFTNGNFATQASGLINQVATYQNSRTPIMRVGSVTLRPSSGTGVVAGD